MKEPDVSFARIYMSPGEYVLWHGCPQKGNLFTKQDVYLIPFSIFWFCLALSRFVVLGAGEISVNFNSLPFMVVGLYLLFGRFIWIAVRRSRTVYVITNQKIIRKRMGNIDMIHRRANLPIQLKVHRNGNGTITVGSDSSWDYDEYHNPQGFSISFGKTHGISQPGSGAFRLENIDDPVRVHRILIQTN